MSDDRTPGKPGQSATLACAAGVTPDTLSAWRDGLLPDAQAAWMAMHTPTCPACGARLRDYEQIGAALRGQFIPHSSADPWPAMLRRIERERRGRRRTPTLPRWGGLGALVAAALLVALFAGLLAHQAARRPTPTSTATVERVTTPTATASAWTVSPGYQGVTNIAIAPSDPRVAYQLWDGVSPATLFRRTDDQGATWHALTLPYIPNASYPVIGAASYVVVNPLDAHVAYLAIDASMHTPITTCSSNGGGESGYQDPLCRYQYISTDSGAHWQPLALPLVGYFGALQGQRDVGAQPGAARVYATISPFGSGSDRLVRSDDNGVSWQLVDAPIIAAGLRVFNYAATPTGSTIFALAEPAGTQAGSFPPLTIWSSDDAGATWTNLGQTPSNYIMAMTAGLVASSGKPMLYLLTASSASSQGVFDIQGSLFGASGSFHVAPTASPACTAAASSSLLGMRPDGSVVVWCGGALQSWLASPVNDGWQTLTQDPATSSIRSAFMQTLPDGSERLWLVTFDNSGERVEYATLPN
jgi:hypothetical protein